MAHSRAQTTVFVFLGCIAAFVGGVSFGFSSIAAHILFWLLAAPLAFASLAIVRRSFSSTDVADVLLRAGLVMLAFVVSCGLLLGTAHLISRAWYAIAEALFVIGGLVAARHRLEIPDATQHSVLPVGFWIAVAAFVLGMGVGHSPFTAYDSLSYHLFFPARWLQAHRLSIIPSPFSDEAQAYQPANGELWFLWLMLPFHGDFLARIGQFPFYLLGATTVYALARRLGAEPTHAVYAPTFFLITPTVVEQAVGANVDLIHAVLFVTSLYLGIVAVDTNERRDWALWGVSTGLFLGTKYLALIYFPVLLALPLLRRGRALWALPGIVMFAVPWYLRNWIIAGSPIYPATLRVVALTLGQGAYSRAAMAQSFLHTIEPRLLLISVVHAFGATAFFVVVPAMLLAAIAILRRKAWWPAGFVFVAVLAMPLFCWFNVGDNADSRFLLPAVVTTVALLPLPFATNKTVNAVVHGLYAFGILWIIVGAETQLPVAVPWFMGDWLTVQGIVARAWLPYFLVLVAAATAVSVALPRQWVGPTAALTVAVTGIALAIGGERWCVPSRCDYVNVASPHLRLTYLYGSRWLTGNVRGGHVAYTGINLPYPLAGSDLANVVSYVNVDRHPTWRFHDYAHAFQRSPVRAVDPARLATPSGLLMPAVARGDGVDALRPRFERMSGDRSAWIANLRTLRVEYVFISTLDPYEIDYVWHNEQRFPIEDEWAKADPALLRLVYENPDVRIYQVGTP